MASKKQNADIDLQGNKLLNATNSTISQAANGDTALTITRKTDTSPTGLLVDLQNAAGTSVYKVDRFGKLTVNMTAQSGVAERLLEMGISDSLTVFSLDNGTTNASQFAPTFNGVIEPTVDSVAISFFGTKGVSGATNPAILFLGRYNSGSGNTDLPATVPLAEFRNRATSLAYVYGNGDIKIIKAGGGVGYGAGAGGTVTQATSKATGVTLNKSSGEITLNNAALAGDTTVSFTLTNSGIEATDLLVLNHASGGTPGSYLLNARCAAGSATIDVRNITTGSLSEAIVIRFALIKGATS